MSGYAYEVLVCGGAGCLSSGCQEIKERIEAELDASGLKEKVRLTLTGCMAPAEWALRWWYSPADTSTRRSSRRMPRT